MGDWGAEPWENDEAADWFHKLWQGCDFSPLIDEIVNFDERTEGYDSFRAASYILEAIGNPYIWPARHAGMLRELLERSIDILEKMIEPPNEDWVFLDMCGNNPKVIESVRDQINRLKTRRGQIRF